MLSVRNNARHTSFELFAFKSVIPSVPIDASSFWRCAVTLAQLPVRRAVVAGLTTTGTD